MKQTFSDTLLLWLLLLVFAVVHIATASGIDLPLLEKTTFWRLEQYPGIGLAIAAVVLLTSLVMGFAQEDKYATALFVAGLYLGVGIMSFIFFDPGTGGAFTATSIAMYRRYRKGHSRHCADDLGR